MPLCQWKFVYTTAKVVKIPNKGLYFLHKLICLFVIFYIGVYGVWHRGGFQGVSRVQSVVVTKVKGTISTKQVTDAEIGIPNAEFYRRVWDASDVVIPSQGDDSGGFIIVTNLVITPNQTRTNCPENVAVDKAVCKTPQQCVLGQILPLGNGPMTGKCVPQPNTINTKTCEVSAWCPVETDKVPFNGKKALLEETKDFTVLVKNSIEFPDFGSAYKRRNIMESATTEYLRSCMWNEKTDPYCPTFRIGDIIEKSNSNTKYGDVSITGGVFALKIDWKCSFDFGATINQCRPSYSFSRQDNPNAHISPGFNFRIPVFHEENRRTLTRNYGIKVVIEVDGEGRKFDSIRLIVVIGSGMGLFALASKVCDFFLTLFFKLNHKVAWKWLQSYSPEMKYDLTYMNSDADGNKTSKSHELDEIKTLQ